jgi:hypothetical protein
MGVEPWEIITKIKIIPQSPDKSNPVRVFYVFGVFL